MGYPLPEHPTVIDVSIATVEADQRVQQRVALDLEKVAEYAALYREGLDLGPLVAFGDGHSLILADGFHRLEAANLAGLSSLSRSTPASSAEVGRQAVFYATSCNLHGAPLTNADKRKRVLTMLSDREWGQWSNNSLAKHCGVAQSFVSKIRHSLSLHSELSEDDDPDPAALS